MHFNPLSSLVSNIFIAVYVLCVLIAVAVFYAAHLGRPLLKKRF